MIPSITVPFDDRYRFCSVLDGGKRSGVQFYFIDYPPFFDRDGLYGTQLGDYHDNAERFAMFSRAVLEAAKVLGAPDILHCHDWQTALIPMLLKTLYDEDPAFAMRHASLPFTTSDTRAFSSRRSCRCSCCRGTCSPCRSWSSTAR